MKILLNAALMSFLVVVECFAGGFPRDVQKLNQHYTQGRIEPFECKYCGFQYHNFESVNLSGTNLEGSILTGASLKGVNAKGINLHHVIAYKSDFSGANIQGAFAQGLMVNNSNLNKMRNETLVFIKNITTNPIPGPAGFINTKIEGMISGTSSI